MADPKKNDDLNRQRALFHLKCLDEGFDELISNLMMMVHFPKGNKEKIRAKQILKEKYGIECE